MLKLLVQESAVLTTTSLSTPYESSYSSHKAASVFKLEVISEKLQDGGLTTSSLDVFRQCSLQATLPKSNFLGCDELAMLYGVIQFGSTDVLAKFI